MPYCTKCGNEVEEKERYCGNCGIPQGDFKEEFITEDAAYMEKDIHLAGKNHSFSMFYRKAGFYLAVLLGCFILIYGGLNLYNKIFALDDNNSLSEGDLTLIDNVLTNDEITYNDFTDIREPLETNNEIQEKPIMIGPTEYLVTVEGENRLHVRQNPGIIDKPDDDIIGRFYRGYLLEVIDNHGNNIFVDNYTWWEIFDPVLGIKGWVAAEYLQKNAASLENNAKFEIRGNTIGNNINQGLVASIGDWLFFIDFNNDWGKIYKIKLDGSAKEKLNDNISRYLNVVDDWVYFSNYDDGNKIYRVHIDGTVSEKINNDNSWSLSVVGDWVYYINKDDSWKIYKVRTDGSGRTKLNDDISSDINIVGDWIYYRSDNAIGKIYKVRTDGRDRTRVNEDHSYSINVLDGWVYYSNYDDGSNIYKIRTDGSEREKLNEDSSGSMNVVDDWIYYLNIDDDFMIYKIRTDGNQRTMINEDQSRLINIVGDWIFYKNVDDGFKLYKIHTDGSGRQKIVK